MLPTPRRALGNVTNNQAEIQAKMDDELWAAAELVGIGELIRQLPKGLDTRLGRAFAGGVELSGGQWRRLLLARALARPAPVLILDEPFAFLDRTARQRLTEALATGGRDRSLLVVDHRPETLDWVDRVVVLADGRITTAEPSDQLLQRRRRD